MPRIPTPTYLPPTPTGLKQLTARFTSQHLAARPALILVAIETCVLGIGAINRLQTFVVCWSIGTTVVHLYIALRTAPPQHGSNERLVKRNARRP